MARQILRKILPGKRPADAHGARGRWRVIQSGRSVGGTFRGNRLCEFGGAPGVIRRPLRQWATSPWPGSPEASAEPSAGVLGLARLHDERRDLDQGFVARHNRTWMGSNQRSKQFIHKRDEVPADVDHFPDPLRSRLFREEVAAVHAVHDVVHGLIGYACKPTHRGGSRFVRRVVCERVHQLFDGLFIIIVRPK